MPEVHTEDTVRAFSGTLRRISGGADFSFVEPLTSSDTTVDAILVDDCNGLTLILNFDIDWLEILLLAPDENPRTPLFVSLPDKRRQITTATLPLLKRIFAIGILVVGNCYEKKCSELCERCAFVSIKFTAAVVMKACLDPAEIGRAHV